MKTEPTEADSKYLEYLHGTTNEKEFLEMDDLLPMHDAIKACNIAFQEGQSSPKIKQLEWVEYENFHGRKSYLSKTPFSSYDVADGGDHFTMFSPNKRLRFASADEAKAAAQKDFEERVEKCIAK